MKHTIIAGIVVLVCASGALANSLPAHMPETLNITPDEIYSAGPMEQPLANSAPPTSMDVTNLPTDYQSFFTTVGLYFTSNDTNLTWLGVKLEIETAAEYQNGMNWANDVRVGYNISDAWQVGAQIDNAGIAGTVQEYQGGITYAVINSHAIKVEAGVDGGYNRLWNSGVAVPRVVLKKKMTTNTYSLLEIGEPIYFRALGSHANSSIPNAWVPQIRVGVGFTY